ncbi:MAG: methylated-DNA--[protein]-cysteine S-methyltransferase [candidate division WOR-3 bacterium]
MYYQSPIGTLQIEFSGQRLKSISKVRKALKKPEGHKNHRIIQLLDDYFRGKKVVFDNLDLELSGLSKFQRQVLLATRKIPYGQVISYKTLATKLKAPKAVRAVGQALKKNPLPIVIPCHRVIRSDRSLGGFSLGLSVKKYLLRLEAKHE